MLRRHESWQADELPLVLLVAALGLAWYAWRRGAEARAAAASQGRASRQVAELLGLNRQLTQQLLGVQESERRALARELHDELGQRCTAIRLDAVLIDGHPTARAASRRIADHAAALHQRLHGLLQRLRPAQLDELGLVEALQAMGKSSGRPPAAWSVCCTRTVRWPTCRMR